MGFKTFTGTTLSSSDMNAYLMKQTVIVCTSGTRPSSPNEGMTIYETDTNRRLTYNGSAWVIDYAETAISYTPELYCGGLLYVAGNATATGYYFRSGRNVTGWANVTFGSTSGLGGATGNLEITIPVAAGSGVSPLGTAVLLDSSAGTVRNRFMRVGSNTSLGFLSDHDDTAVTHASWSWAVGDYIKVQFQYEAAAST